MSETEINGKEDAEDTCDTEPQNLEEMLEDYRDFCEAAASEGGLRECVSRVRIQSRKRN